MQVTFHPWIYQLHHHDKAETAVFIFKKVQTKSSVSLTHGQTAHPN